MWSEVKAWLFRPSDFVQLQEADAVQKMLIGPRDRCQNCNGICFVSKCTCGEMICSQCLVEHINGKELWPG